MMGRRWRLQILARALTSSTQRGNSTTSGGQHLDGRGNERRQGAHRPVDGLVFAVLLSDRFPH
ncbi:hypothetical protein EYF80_045832 [Liparis tanakae]|uniref:Uncharacterized protein n=1 Tax=Liparis tanakae TaxID=230148 RepID=A0A4Z2FRW6_9TELE|nr:hypothetical protein EYF80_045832 [Liparis tanakae]